LITRRHSVVRRVTEVGGLKLGRKRLQGIGWDNDLKDLGTNKKGF